MPRKENRIKEVWKVIPDYEIYEVSSLGGVRSIDRIVPQRVRGGTVANIHRKGKALRQKTYTGGYKSVYLYSGSKERNVSVHRLVARAFLKNTHNKRCVHHRNGIRDDNRLANLKWVTHSENNKEAYVTGNKTMRGESNSMSKLTNDMVKEIKLRLGFGASYKLLAKEYCVSNQCVKDIEIGRRWGWLQP